MHAKTEPNLGLSSHTKRKLVLFMLTKINLTLAYDLKTKLKLSLCSQEVRLTLVSAYKIKRKLRLWSQKISFMLVYAPKTKPNFG
jgi:hypothetical protein